MDDDEPISDKPISVGDNLAGLSMDELAKRIVALKSEIARVEDMLSQKKNSQSEADALFKK